jgi:hypothetical protein
MIFCEVVDQDELEEIMDDLEAEMNEDDVEDEREDKLEEEMQPALPETGSRLTPGSNQQVITTGVTIPSELEGQNRDKMKSKLERKALTDNGSEPLEEDNIPYIADPESSSTAQYKPASKLAEATRLDIMKAAAAKAAEKSGVTKKQPKKKPKDNPIKLRNEEKVDEAISAAARAKLGDVAKKHGGKVPFESTTFKGGKAVTIKGHYNEKGERVITGTSEEEDQKKK